MKQDEAVLNISSHPGDIVLLIFACCCFILPWCPFFKIENYFWGAAVFCFLCGLLFLAFSILYGKTYSFYRDRIEHRILGICFRRTAWKDVTSVMRLYTGERSLTYVGFLFTAEQVKTSKPDNHTKPWKTPFDMCFKIRGFWHEWLVGKHFFVQQFSKKQEAEILSCITNHWGELAYDVRCAGDSTV